MSRSLGFCMFLCKQIFLFEQKSACTKTQKLHSCGTDACKAQFQSNKATPRVTPESLLSRLLLDSHGNHSTLDPSHHGAPFLKWLRSHVQAPR